MTTVATKPTSGRRPAPSAAAPLDTTVPYAPHTDTYSESAGVFIQALLNWRITTIIGFAILLTAVVALSTAVIILAHRKPLVETLVVDRAGKQMSIASLKPLYADADAQVAIAKYFLPLVIEKAFTVTAPDEDVRNIHEFVRPFILPESQAAQFFLEFFTKHNPAKLSTTESVAVHVDPIGQPRGINHYFVGWTETATNGYRSSTQHYTADIQVVFRDATAENPAGLFVQAFSLDTETTGTQ